MPAALPHREHIAHRLRVPTDNSALAFEHKQARACISIMHADVRALARWVSAYFFGMRACVLTCVRLHLNVHAIRAGDEHSHRRCYRPTLLCWLTASPVRWVGCMGAFNSGELDLDALAWLCLYSTAGRNRNPLSISMKHIGLCLPWCVVHIVEYQYFGEHFRIYRDR